MKMPVLAIALLCAGSIAWSHDYRAGGLTIAHPYARPTGPAQAIGGGYLKLVNQGPADRLVAVSSPVAGSVQLHSMRMEGDVMRMREIAAIDLPSGQTVELRPGGLHLMLVGLKAPLVVGQRFSLKLKFEKAGEIDVEVTVDAPTGAEARHDKAH